MATPKTISLPIRTNGRGGFALTSEDRQGIEATMQLIMLSVVPPGKTKHPWKINVGMNEDFIFEQPGKGEADLIARMKEEFARHESRHRVRLVPGSIKISHVEGEPHRRTVTFRWQDLRRPSAEPSEHSFIV